MPREARKKGESGIYHVMLRGINRQAIFLDNEDCEKYLRCLADIKAVSGFTLYAYCLMGNHIHLLIKEGKEPLAQIFKRIGARFVFWYNWKHKRSGHLFQDRFKSEPIKDDAQFVAVLRYIYQNPVKANICSKPEDYRWSSYRSLGLSPSIADNSQVLKLIPLDQLRTFVEMSDNDQYLDLEPDKRLTDVEAAELIKEVCKVYDVFEIMALIPETRAENLRTLHQKGCSVRQLQRITGISKNQLERILKDKGTVHLS